MVLVEVGIAQIAQRPRQTAATSILTIDMFGLAISSERRVDLALHQQYRTDAVGVACLATPIACLSVQIAGSLQIDQGGIHLAPHKIGRAQIACDLSLTARAITRETIEGLVQIGRRRIQLALAVFLAAPGQLETPRRNRLWRQTVQALFATVFWPGSI